MKRLILDHYRRWAWVLALCAALEFLLGLYIAWNPKIIFEFWAFLLAIWAGATLLGFDLKRGALRTVATLPLTGRQIGRGWWLASVPIPSVVLTALLFSGAAAFCCLNPDRPFPTERLCMASLFTLAWLGMDFALAFNATRGQGGSYREFYCNGLISLLTMLMFFGSMALCNGASDSPLKSALILGGGGLLTLLGWFRAEQFDLRFAGLYLGRIEPPKVGGKFLTPLARKIPDAHYRVPSGCGGVPFLLRTTFVRTFLTIAAMVLLMTMLLRWQNQTVSKDFEITFLFMGSFMSCWVIVFSLFTPFLQQLRFFRTLPISAARLAFTMLAIALLPFIAVGAAVTGFVDLSQAPDEAIIALGSYTFVLAPTALSVFFLIWRGSGRQGYALVILTLLCFLVVYAVAGQTYLANGTNALRLAVPIAAAAISLAFILTRWVFRHSSAPYRVQATSMIK
jgi:hypothetical protein